MFLLLYFFISCSRKTHTLSQRHLLTIYSLNEKKNLRSGRSLKDSLCFHFIIISFFYINYHLLVCFFCFVAYSENKFTFFSRTFIYFILLFGHWSSHYPVSFPFALCIFSSYASECHERKEKIVREWEILYTKWKIKIY